MPPDLRNTVLDIVAYNADAATWDKLHAMAQALLQYETIDAAQINEIMEGREPGPPADWIKAGKSAPPRNDCSGPNAGATVGGPAPQV